MRPDFVGMANEDVVGVMFFRRSLALGGAGDIESAAYLGSYDPTNLCLNYLGDSGVVGLGTTLGSAFRHSRTLSW